jgi:hypothetical protein
MILKEETMTIAFNNQTAMIGNICLNGRCVASKRRKKGKSNDFTTIV